MKKILIVSSEHKSSELDIIREKFPDVEIITKDEAKERNMELPDRPRVDGARIINDINKPILEDISFSRKEYAQPWKRRGKNTKV